MDLSFSESQQLLRKSARDFFHNECPKSLVREMEKDENGCPPNLWKKMADLGWMGLIVPEKYGGVGGDYLDFVILVEEMGRACLPAPFLSTALGAMFLLEAGTEEQKTRLLPRIASGENIFTLALPEEWQQVVLAQAVEIDVLDDHHLAVVDREQRVVEDLVDVFVVPARQERQGLRDAGNPRRHPEG